MLKQKEVPFKILDHKTKFKHQYTMTSPGIQEYDAFLLGIYLQECRQLCQI